ncbi:multiple inositol polyphosphate phosphatase 1 [Manduca sexta]|uniref:Multiple inositol polyphosphate phosphatase 1 n=1 Tax=Manduca sexta TaxID=7130 RepID=A0A921YX07_MANSE|nr:multiple inositol polyphosphate phosphatase 1 [Manduca sexta]KAG6446409.1 hypothetical protein O3G_MSEX004438 [Manduca sexta]
MKLTVLTVFICIYLKSVSSLFCYWNTGCPYKYFSSKTPYNAVRGDIRDSVAKLKGCEPVSIWGLFRHGKRNPGIDFGKSMRDALIIKDYVIASYMNGNSSLCAQDIQNLRNYVIDDEMFNKVHQLSDEGYQDMVAIGSRLKEAYPKFLSNLEKGSYTFRSAFGNWMEKSCKGFVSGLQEILDVEPATTDFDIIAPYTTCGKYQRDIKKNLDTYAETFKYQETSEFLAAKDRIQRRLGIDYILTNDNITSLYDICRYTSSDKMSPWCAMFTTEDLKVLEYIGDLRHYYRNGYGNSINQVLGQIPLTDLLKSFQLAKAGNGKKIVSYFTHATMIDMVYTSLNLFKDDIPLTAAHRSPERKWRSSKFSVFSANLMAVLNRCGHDDMTEYKVVFYLNEEPLIPLCKEGVCTWEEFEDMLKTMSVNTDICEFKSVPYI